MNLFLYASPARVEFPDVSTLAWLKALPVKPGAADFANNGQFVISHDGDDFWLISFAAAANLKSTINSRP